MTDEYDVFLSYSKSDKTSQEIVKIIQGLGITSWIDKLEISADEYDFTTRMASGINQSKILIAIISENYLNSYYCLLEYINGLISIHPFKSIIRVIITDKLFENHPLSIISQNYPHTYTTKNNLISQINEWLSDDDLNDVREPIPKSSYVKISEKIHSFPKNSLLYIEELIGNFILCDNLVSHTKNRDFQKIAISINLAEAALIKEQNQFFWRDIYHSRLGYAYYTIGKYQEAVGHNEIPYKKSQLSKHNDSIDSIEHALALASSLFFTERRNEAISICNSMLLLINRKFASNHQIYIKTIHEIASIFTMIGDTPNAIRYFNKIFEILPKSSIKINSDEYLTIKSNYAFAKMQNGELVEAWHMLNTCLAGYTEILDKRHTKIGQTEIKLAECALLGGFYDLANFHALRAMQILNELSASHPIRTYAEGVAKSCARAVLDSNNKPHPHTNHFISNDEIYLPK